MDERRSAVAVIAAAQHSVFTSSDWSGAGLSPRQLRSDLRSGSLIRLGRRTFTFPGHAGSWEQRLFAALAEFPAPEDDAVAGGVSAARLLRLDGDRPDDIELSVAPPARRRSADRDFLVRSHSPLSVVDRTIVNGFPTLSASRLIIEECGRWSTSTLESCVDSAIRLGWTSETFLRRRLEQLRKPGKRGVRALDRVLAGAGGHSWLEREFLRIVRAARLPEPELQVTFQRGGRFVARVDACWASRRLVVEVAGHTTHATRRQRQHDAQRQAELATLGYRVVTFTYEDVVERPGYVVEALRHLIGGTP